MTDIVIMVIFLGVAIGMKEKFAYILAGFAVLAYFSLDFFGFDSSYYRGLLLFLLAGYLIVRGLLDPGK
jgi:hypothetical protein